jgi:hypothetical protein
MALKLTRYKVTYVTSTGKPTDKTVVATKMGFADGVEGGIVTFHAGLQLVFAIPFSSFVKAEDEPDAPVLKAV